MNSIYIYTHSISVGINCFISNYVTCVECTEPYSRRRRNVVRSTPNRSGVGGANSTNVQSPEEKSTEYAVFALVPIFCVMGLLGIFICNLLKKKGYRCNAEKEGIDAEAATPQKEGTIHSHAHVSIHNKRREVIKRNFGRSTPI